MKMENATPLKYKVFSDETHLCCINTNFLWSARYMGVKLHEESKYFIRIYATRLLVPILLLVFMRKVQNLRVYTPTWITTRACQGRQNVLKS